jgi:hypothetical protein
MGITKISTHLLETRLKNQFKTTNQTACLSNGKFLQFISRGEYKCVRRFAVMPIAVSGRLLWCFCYLSEAEMDVL